MKNDDKRKKRWRIIRWIAYATAGVLATGIILFAALIFNPLERDYAGPLLKLVPVDSDIAIYCPSTSQVREKLAWITNQDLTSSRRYQEFTRSSLYNRLLSDVLAEREGIESDFGIDILDWKYLSQAIGKEVAIAVRSAPAKDRDDFLMLTRITWKCKLVDGVLPYLTGGEVAEGVQLDLKEDLRSFKTPEWEGYWTRHRDVLIFASDRDFMTDALALLQDSRGSLWEVAEVKRQLEAKRDILWYKANTADEDRQPDNREELLDGICPGTAFYTGTIAIRKDKRDIDIALVGKFRATREQRKFTPIEWDTSEILSKNTIMYASFSIEPQKFWTDFKNCWSPELKENIAPYLEKLDYHHGEPDFIGKCCARYLKNDAAVALSSVDFVKENLQPFEPYPAFALIFKTPHAGEFFQVLEESLVRIKDIIVEREFASKSDFTFFVKEAHGECPYIRIKYPDKSGGAVKPAIGAWGPYLIITSHTGFFREFLDIADGYGSSLAQKSGYPQVRDLLRKPHIGNFYIDPEPTVASVRNLRKQCFEWYLENASRQSVSRSAIQEEFDLLLEVLQHLQMWDLQIAMSWEADSAGVGGNISIPIEIRN